MPMVVARFPGRPAEGLLDFGALLADVNLVVENALGVWIGHEEEGKVKALMRMVMVWFRTPFH